MARLLTIARSPFIYIEYRTATGIRRESTKQRADSREGRRNAHRLLVKKQAEERMLTHAPAQSAFDRWVEPWLRQHCADSPLTCKAYLHRWNIIGMFLRSRGILFPAQLAYAHCQEYLEYRTSSPDEIKSVSQNTARDDLGTLRLIMNEAVRRDYCITNPCTQLRIKTVPRREKPEITDAQAAAIREELANGARQCKSGTAPWPRWMRVQFEIAHHTGRRISETKMAMRTLDLEHCAYTVRVKGGKIKTKPFHPDLLPFLRDIQGEFTHSIGPSHSTRMWRLLFDQLGMEFHTFHCCRITLISRLRRSGVDRWTAMKVVDHASASIHALYNRYDEADLRGALAKVFPTVEPARSEPPPLSSCPSHSALNPPEPERKDRSG